MVKKIKELNGQILISKKEIDLFSDRKRVNLINSLSGYKSANLVATIDENGKTNVSIFNSVFHLGASPALIGFIIRPDVSRRDTLNNLRLNGLCTINHVNSDIYKNAHQTSARYNQDESEFDECNLTTEFLDEFKAPFVKESFIKFSVKMLREEVIPENGTHMIIGEIQNIYLPDNCLTTDGSIDINQAKTICVSGLDTYFECNLIEKLQYAKKNK